MAGSLQSNAAIFKKSKYTYVAPMTPIELIDSSMFVIDFVNRKFLNIGLDPSNNFKLIIRIITPSRHISISHCFLKRIYSFMGNILSMILDTPDENKNLLLFSDEVNKLSKTIYRNENNLVIESKLEEGCRVLLNRADLKALQYMEWAIFEACVGKTTFIRPMVLQQFNQITNYIKSDFKRGINIDEMKKTIQNLNDALVSTHTPAKNPIRFISQLKLLATRQLAEECVIKEEAVSEDETIQSCFPLFQCSPLSSTMCEDTNMPPSPIYSQAVDENDGPLYFNRPTTPTYAVQTTSKVNRKLFL